LEIARVEVEVALASIHVAPNSLDNRHADGLEVIVTTRLVTFFV